MKRTTLVSMIPIAILVISACRESAPNDTIEVVNEYADLQAMFDNEPDQVWVINFWATSCPPCIKEMPHFRDLYNAYKDKEVRILLVSTDKVADLDSRVYPFVGRYDITPEVVVLADQNYSAWTDKVDPSWYGALPATMIFRGDEKTFKFGAYASYEELESDLISIAPLK